MTSNPGSAFGVAPKPVQLGLYLGGLISTWSADSLAPQLWSVEPAGLPNLMYRGLIGKVARSVDTPSRYRESGLLDLTNHTLTVQVEGEAEPQVFQLGSPRDIDEKRTWFDLGAAMISAIRFTAETPGKVLVLERGGLTAPHVPFALFTIQNGEVVVETRPAPRKSQVWERYLTPDSEAGVVQSPISDQALRSAGMMMVDASRTWGLTPWDLALTYSA
ncbi:MAG: hypothetical protein FWG25_08560 [Promicromonosporaceae bacterium]|nr:hypothetical protein [Promicromonosporaceae bacterium]